MKLPSMKELISISKGIGELIKRKNFHSIEFYRTIKRLAAGHSSTFYFSFLLFVKRVKKEREGVGINDKNRINKKIHPKRIFLLRNWHFELIDAVNLRKKTLIKKLGTG